MEEVVDKINNLYKSPEGGVGGYGHIVFDDGNIETENILWCISEAEKGEYEHIGNETRLKSIIALKSLLPLNEDERESAISMFFKKFYKWMGEE